MPDVPKAIALIRNLEKSLSYRFEMLKLNGCKDLEAFYKKPKNEIKFVEGQYKEPMVRIITVIDEVASLFMASSEMKSKDVQDAKRIVAKIGSQGRAVGLHLVVATQRPDVKALDSQIKTHLAGVVCFPMVNDASSMTVLGSGRATDLPRIPGRAIWKSGLDLVEVQTPYCTPEEVNSLIKPEAQSVDLKGDANASSIEGSRPSALEVPLEMESSNDGRTSN